MPKRGLEPPHLTTYAPKAYVATITPLGLKGGSDNSLSGYSSGEITPFQARHLPFDQRQETGRELSPSAPPIL